MFCVVQYQNANPDKSKGGFFYPVPYFDITTKAKENKMLFQWAIEGPATAYSGRITFSVQFYKISSITVDNIDGTSTSRKVYDYLLNTMPVTSKILHGLDIEAVTENYYFEPNEVKAIYQRIEEVRRTNDLYWIVVNDLNDLEKLDQEDYPENTINKNEIINSLITG